MRDSQPIWYSFLREFSILFASYAHVASNKTTDSNKCSAHFVWCWWINHRRNIRLNSMTLRRFTLSNGAKTYHESQNSSSSGCCYQSNEKSFCSKTIIFVEKIKIIFESIEGITFSSKNYFSRIASIPNQPQRSLFEAVKWIKKQIVIEYHIAHLKEMSKRCKKWNKIKIVPQNVWISLVWFVNRQSINIKLIISFYVVSSLKTKT